MALVNEATPHCPENVCDREGFSTMQNAGDTQTVGLVMGGVGAALVGVGIALYVTAPSGGPRGSAPTVTARLGPGSAMLEGAF